jgi:hypothetical protein
VTLLFWSPAVGFAVLPSAAECVSVLRSAAGNYEVGPKLELYEAQRTAAASSGFSQGLTVIYSCYLVPLFFGIRQRTQK